LGADGQNWISTAPPAVVGRRVSNVETCIVNINRSLRSHFDMVRSTVRLFVAGNVSLDAARLDGKSGPSCMKSAPSIPKSA